MKFWQWFLIVLAAVLVLVLVVLSYAPLRRVYIRRHLVKIYYKTVHKVALYGDYFLINQLILKIDETNQLEINHLLLADKYIYVINDAFYPGKLTGKMEDESLLFAFGFGRRRKAPKVVDNPLKRNRTRIEKLALITGLDLDLFISIVLVNDDGDFSEIASINKMDYIIQRKDFLKLVNAIEKRPVVEINAIQLAAAVADINRLNLRKLRGRQ